MDQETDSLAECERELGRLGYDLFDLGTDFGSSDHLYYLFSRKSGVPVIGQLLFLEEVKRIVKRLDPKAGLT